MMTTNGNYGCVNTLKNVAASQAMAAETTSVIQAMHTRFMYTLQNKQYSKRTSVWGSFSFCIGRENKPPAMQVCPQIALASSKTPVSINI